MCWSRLELKSAVLQEQDWLPLIYTSLILGVKNIIWVEHLDCYFYLKPNACCSHQVSVLSMLGNVPIRLLYQMPDHMNDSVCTPVVGYGTLSHHQQSLTLMLHQIANSYWKQMTSNQSDVASGSNHCLFECSWMQCCQQNHVRSVYARPRVIPMSWTPLCGRLEVNLCRATSVSVVSSTLDYNNRKTLIIIIINSSYYYYYKNNNNNDHFIHSHFTEVKIKRVSAVLSSGLGSTGLKAVVCVLISERARLPSSVPSIDFSLCQFSLSFLVAGSVYASLHRVSVLGTSCSTSVWSTRGCRTWTSAPMGNMPLYLRLCTLGEEKKGGMRKDSCSGWYWGTTKGKLESLLKR